MHLMYYVSEAYVLPEFKIATSLVHLRGDENIVSLPCIV